MTDVATSLQAIGESWEVAGAVTMDSAANLLEASKPLVMAQSGVIDLARVERVDSAGVSLLLAWKRRAAVEGKSLRLAGVPPSMRSLAELYGVEDMLSD